MRPSVFGTVFTALLAAHAAEAQVPAGGEFQVNDPTSAHQTFPSVAADPGGAFVVVWADYASTRTLQGRRFHASGVPRGAQFQVNTAPVAAAQRPDVAVHATGRVMAVWFNVDGAGVPPGIFGRVFDAAGTPLGPQFTINTTPGGLVPAIAATPAGFVVVWGTGPLSSGDTAIAGRRFDVAGNPLGAEFQVNASTTGHRALPSVAAAGNGRFVVVWTSPAQNYTLSVSGQAFDASGARLGDEFAAGTASGPADVAADALGDFVVVWASPPGSEAPILGRRFDAGGSPLGEEFAVSTATGESSNAVSVASDRAGNFTVAWDSGAFPGPFGVFGRRFTAGGEPRGAQFRVSGVTTDSQVVPEVAADASGNLIVAWTGAPLPPASMNIFGQRYGGLRPGGDCPWWPASTACWSRGRLRPGHGVAQPQRRGRRRSRARSSSRYRCRPGCLAVDLGRTARLRHRANGAGRRLHRTVLRGHPVGHSGRRSTPTPASVETIAPDAHGPAQRWTLHVGDSFTDVPRASPFYRFVETLLHRGITGGCGAARVLPGQRHHARADGGVRAGGQGGRGLRAAGLHARRCSATCRRTSPFCPWIEELARRGRHRRLRRRQLLPDRRRHPRADGGVRAAHAGSRAEPARLHAAQPVQRRAGDERLLPLDRGAGAARHRGRLRRRQLLPGGAGDARADGVFLGVTFGLTLYGP